MKETEEAYRNLYARKGEDAYDKIVKRLEEDAVRLGVFRVGDS